MSLDTLSRWGRGFGARNRVLNVHFTLWIIYNIAIASSRSVEQRLAQRS